MPVPSLPDQGPQVGMETNQKDPQLDDAHTARWLAVPTSYLTTLVEEHGLPASTGADGMRMISATEVRAWLESKRVEAKKEHPR